MGSGWLLGHPWPRSYASRAPLWERPQAHRGLIDLSGLDGSFCAISTDDGDQTWVATDRCGTIPVYRAVGPDGTTAAGNDPNQVARAAGLELELDLHGAWQWLFFGYIPGTRTPLRGVTHVPLGTWANLATGELRSYWRHAPSPTGTVGDHHADLLELEDRVVSAALDAAPGPVVLKLSGGWDSRALLVRLHEAGAPLRALTFGDADSPDVRIAAQLAAGFGIDHEVLPYRRDLDRLRTWGALSADLSDYAYTTLRTPGFLSSIEGSLWSGTDNFCGGLRPDRGFEPILYDALSHRGLPPLLFEGLGAESDALHEAFAEIDELATVGPGESVAAAFDRITLEHTHARWNNTRWLRGRFAPVITPWMSVDVTEYYHSLPVELRAGKRAHIAANRARFPAFGRFDLHSGGAVRGMYQPVIDDPELRRRMLDDIEACPEVAGLIDTRMFAKADRVGWHDQYYLSLVVLRMFMLSLSLESARLGRGAQRSVDVDAVA